MRARTATILWHGTTRRATDRAPKSSRVSTKSSTARMTATAESSTRHSPGANQSVSEHQAHMHPSCSHASGTALGSTRSSRGNVSPAASQSGPRVGGLQQLSSPPRYPGAQTNAESSPAQSIAQRGPLNTGSGPAPLRTASASSTQPGSGPMTLEEFRRTYRDLTEVARRNGLTRPQHLSEREERWLADNYKVRRQAFCNLRDLWRRKQQEDEGSDPDSVSDAYAMSVNNQPGTGRHEPSSSIGAHAWLRR